MSDPLTVEQVLQSLQAIVDLHQPQRGEAREDRNRYCSVCQDGTGGSARYPCATVRMARKCLQAEELR